MIDGFGINVLRQVPIEYISGIVSQIYSVHGGVIREAATGRIVAHLAIPEAGAALAGAVPGLGFLGDLAQTYQLHALSQNVQQVLSVSLANTALAGLGLATSLAGFVYLSRKLSALDGRVAEIKDWLASGSEGQLRAAVADLSHSARAQEPETRRQLLLSAKSSFTGLAHHYRSQAAIAKSIAVAEVYEDYSVTAMIGAVMCVSDLGLHDAAAEDFKALRAEWSSAARTRVASLLDLENAARLLDGRYAAALPAASLVAILDFAKDESRGIGWIDELRKGFGTVASLTSGLRPLADDAIAYARKLRAKNDVLANYEEHFRYLSARRMTVSSFSKLVQKATEGGRLAVLVPTRVTTPG